MASVASRRPRGLPRIQASLPKGNWWVWVLVLGLLVVSLFLRTFSLGESLWMDEGLSIGISAGFAPRRILPVISPAWRYMLGKSGP